MLVNTHKTYGLVAQLLHWTTAILILTLLGLGLFMVELPETSGADVESKSWFYSLHKTIGVTTLIVASLRILWALLQPHPLPLNAERKLESLAAQSVHWMLYGSILLMPLTGWLHHSALDGFAPIWWPLAQDLPLIPKNPHLAEIFGAGHFFTGVLLVVSLALHIGGALKHVVIDRDQTLVRMIPGMKADIADDLMDSSHKQLPILIAALSILAVIAASIGVNQLNRPVAGDLASPTAVTNAQTSSWTVDHEKSELGIAVIQSGTPIMGAFASWNAAINFDADNLAGSRAEVVVKIASLSLGGVSARAISSDFLNAELHPTATFLAEEFVNTGENTFEARGTLNLAGQSNPFVIPFELKVENDRAFMTGKTTIKRLEFGIGAAGFPDEGTVGFNVDVTIKIEADRRQ